MAPLNAQLRRLATALALCIALSWPRHGVTLPITSEPLAYNPADLAWQALLAIDTQPSAGVGGYRSDGAHGGEETRAKVAKSIFITPNFNESASTCKPGWRHDPVSGKCHKVNIQLNQQDLLTMQALQAFVGAQGNKYGTPAAASASATATAAASTAAMQSNDAASYSYGDSVEYDYDEEIEQGGALGGSSGPYHVPLTLGFGPDTFSGTTAALKPQPPQQPQFHQPLQQSVDIREPFRDEFGFFRKSTTAAQSNRVTAPAVSSAGINGSPANVHGAGSNRIATPVPSTTLADDAYVVGAPERVVDAGATLAIELPNRQLTTRAALAPTTEMTPVDRNSTSTTEATATDAVVSTTVEPKPSEVVSTTVEQKIILSTTEVASTTVEQKQNATTVTDTETDTTESTPMDLETAATEAVSVTEVGNAIDTTTMPEQTDDDAALATSTNTDSDQATETTTDIFADVLRSELNKLDGQDAQGDRVDPLIRELERESLLHEQETATDATTEPISETTTSDVKVTESPTATTTVESPIEANEKPIIVSEPLVAEDDDTVVGNQKKESTTVASTTTTTTTENAESTTIEHTTKANVIVVTPEPVSTTTTATTTTEESATPIAILVLAKPLPPVVVGSDGGSDVSASEAAVQQHERNEDARERIEQHNRFVYAHLQPPPVASGTTDATATSSSSSTTAELSSTASKTDAPATSTESTTTTTTTTAQPTRPSLIDQLRLINRFAEHNRNRIRFPGTDAADSAPVERPSIFVNRRTGGASTGFRFPTVAAAAVDSLHHAGAGRAVAHADNESSGSAASSLFSWLPTNWRIAASREAPPVQSGPALEEHSAQRKALSFWSSMPLVRDSSARLLGAQPQPADESSAGAANSATDRSARANSKSPTEWLFRQPQDSRPIVDAVVEPAVPGSDEVFRVLTTKTARFSNR